MENSYLADLEHSLIAAEGSGRIEYKRSCLWPSENDAHRVQKVLMRIANANPARGGIIHLGREDDGTIVGLVDRNLAPVGERDLRSAEQTLVAYANRLSPPMHLKWHVNSVDVKQTILVEVPGRAIGNWYEGEDGVTWTGSASHPVKARREHLLGWSREHSDLTEHLAHSKRVRPLVRVCLQSHGRYSMMAASVTIA